MFDWLYKASARLFAFVLVRNRVTKEILVELAYTQYELDELRKQHQAYVASSTALIQACYELHNYLEQLSSFGDVIRFTVSEDIEGSELYALALGDRLMAFRCAAMGVPYEKKVNCTDMFSGQEMWNFRRKGQTVN